jgi:hypothetical protein
MGMKNLTLLIFFLNLLTWPGPMLLAQNQAVSAKTHRAVQPSFRLIPSKKFLFRSFVDCNMASVWVGDSFRIFPGKYGEDPLWGDSRELRYTSGISVDAVFNKKPEDFIEPQMPANAPPGHRGLHGAVWFETLYQDPGDQTGKTLFALYHNENYPSTLPYDSVTGEGYIDKDWPEGLRGPETKTAVCRIGIMKSMDGGGSWSDRGIILEDLQPRLILRPQNTGINFAGGVGDPSAVANGSYLYIFYGEYGYPGRYHSKTYDPVTESKGQCISIARIPLSDLDNPSGLARRWDGTAFLASGNGIGKPVTRLQFSGAEGGGPASSPHSKYYWGPSVSWNDYLHCWVMLMALAEGPSWNGNSIYISYNHHADLSISNHAQEWSKPKLLLKKPGHILWYPSLQPLNTASDKKAGYTSVRLGRKARLFYKDTTPGKGNYISEYQVSFE